MLYRSKGHFLKNPSQVVDMHNLYLNGEPAEGKVDDLARRYGIRYL